MISSDTGRLLMTLLVFSLIYVLVVVISDVNLTQTIEEEFKTTEIMPNSTLILDYFQENQQTYPYVLASNLKYIRSEFAKNLDCALFFSESKAFIDEYAKNRIVLDDEKIGSTLPMDCYSIFNRTYFQRENLYPEEREFPLAFARVVYRDYYLIERELAATYAPQNFYCYVMDSNSPKQFHSQMRALANCFPNVFVMKKEFDLDSKGKNMNYAHFECMKALAKPRFKWKYIVLLQNHELALKTNRELIQIFKWYNGTNDIHAAKVDRAKELEASADWSFKGLKLFKDEYRNTNLKLRFAKSTVHVSASREMIDFILNKLDLTRLMKQVEASGPVVNGHKMNKDEFLIGSLNTEDAIEVPGGFTHSCLDKGVENWGLTILVYWSCSYECKAKNMTRHSICIIGVEYLKELMDKEFLFANKFLPSMDYGAAECWHERMHNRTHVDRKTNTLEKSIYRNKTHVRFNLERQKLGDKFDSTAFKC